MSSHTASQFRLFYRHQEQKIQFIQFDAAAVFSFMRMLQIVLLIQSSLFTSSNNMIHSQEYEMSRKKRYDEIGIMFVSKFFEI